MDKKVVFITGVSSGFGLSLAKKMIDAGHIVYGIGRNEFQLDNLNYHICDVVNYEKLKFKNR